MLENISYNYMRRLCKSIRDKRYTCKLNTEYKHLYVCMCVQYVRNSLYEHVVIAILHFHIHTYAYVYAYLYAHMHSYLYLQKYIHINIRIDA